MPSPILTGLVNQLDASVLLLSGFSDGQSLLNATVPDKIDPLGWTGTGYSLYLSASASPVGTPVIRFISGNLVQNNNAQAWNYIEMTVMIAGKRTSDAGTGRWMGLYSMMYSGGWGKTLMEGIRSYSNGGMSILAITDNNYDQSFTGWGTYSDFASYRSTSAMELNIPTVVSVVAAQDTACTFYTNASATGDQTFASKAQPYYGLGGLEAKNQSFIGDIYEVLVYNRCLSASEISTNNLYLTNKWFA